MLSLCVSPLSLLVGARVPAGRHASTTTIMMSGMPPAGFEWGLDTSAPVMEPPKAAAPPAAAPAAAPAAEAGAAPAAAEESGTVLGIDLKNPAGFTTKDAAEPAVAEEKPKAKAKKSKKKSKK